MQILQMIEYCVTARGAATPGMRALRAATTAGRITPATIGASASLASRFRLAQREHEFLFSCFLQQK